MKLKNKLVGLGIATLVLSGFCTNRISVDAMQNSNNCNNSAKIIEIEKIIKRMKEDFKDRGLDKCSDKPFFLVACRNREQKDFGAFGIPSLVVMCSPEALKEELHEKAKEIVGIEVIDKNGKKYRINKLIYDLAFEGYFLMDADCFSLYDLNDFEAKQNEKMKEYSEKQGVTIDEGFDFNGLNEEYTVCLLDKNGKTIIKGKALAVDMANVHGGHNEKLTSSLQMFSHGTQFDDVTVRSVVFNMYKSNGEKYKSNKIPPHKIIY